VKTSLTALVLAALNIAPMPALARSFDPGTLSAEQPAMYDWENDREVAQQQTPTPPPPPPPSTDGTPPPPAEAPPATEESPLPDLTTPEGEAAPEDDFSIGDIPVVETVELTADKAKKGLDVYLLVREKYKDADLENFENWQDFVDKSPQGKSFEADLKAAGFSNATEWNTVVTTLSFTYDNSIKDDTAEIKKQIDELKADTEMAQDMRDRMINALNAMIPSDNNKKVLAELKADPAYAEKVKLLETESETE
jgi:hypothetical protein